MPTLPPETIIAKAEALKLGAPVKAYQAYRMQKNRAKQRGVAFSLTFTDWWMWWQANDWNRRGRKAGCTVMARFGDIGAYALGNIYGATMQQNAQHVAPSKRKAGSAKAWRTRLSDPDFVCHLSVRGDGHPRSKAVISPLGRFGSAALAAEANGISHQAARLRARQQRMGWSYEGKVTARLA